MIPWQGILCWKWNLEAELTLKSIETFLRSQWGAEMIYLIVMAMQQVVPEWHNSEVRRASLSQRPFVVMLLGLWDLPGPFGEQWLIVRGFTGASSQSVWLYHMTIVRSGAQPFLSCHKAAAIPPYPSRYPYVVVKDQTMRNLVRMDPTIMQLAGHHGLIWILPKSLILEGIFHFVFIDNNSDTAQTIHMAGQILLQATDFPF